VAVVSWRPLPPFAQWQARHEQPPWLHQEAVRGLWRSDGVTLDPVDPANGRQRGEVVELEGQPPLLRLCGWARGDDVDAVEALAFPVFSRKGK
jgi:hypothetical protein